MNVPVRESKWLIVVMLAAAGFGVLVLTIGSIDQRMAVLHRQQRGDPSLARNEKQSSSLDAAADSSRDPTSESEEEVNENDSPQERIRKKFGMVKIAGVWLPAARAKIAAASGMAAGSAGSEAGTPYSVPLYITTGKLPEGRAGERYQSKIEAIGGAPPYAWSIERGAVAESIRLDRASGTLTGTPSAAETKTVRIRVTDVLGAADIAEYKMRITDALVAAAVISPAETLGADASIAASVSDASESPADPAKNSESEKESEAEKKPAPLVISSASLAEARVGDSFTAQFTASGGAAPYAWASLGLLPPGLSLTTSGVLAGTPQTPGDYSLSITVTDQTAQNATQGFTLTVMAAVPDAVTDFTAFISLRKVALAWTNPADPALASVRIVRNPLNPPAHELDGVILSDGLDPSVVDSSPPSGGSFYAAFALNADGTASPPALLAVTLNANAEPFADSVLTWSPLNASAFGQSSLPGIVLGSPQGGGYKQGSTHVVSLGAASVDDPGGAPYGGNIVIGFENNLAYDGPGADLTIFENVFYIKGATGYDPDTRMMEPAIVSVSQDGVTWHTFPFDFSPRYDASTGALNLRHPFVYNKGFAGVNPVLTNNKFNTIDPTDPAVSGGDSFDLADLHVPGLSWIRYVRIQSTGEKWLVDSDGELVRHPNTTSFNEASRVSPSAGFDLDAVTAIWLDAVR